MTIALGQSSQERKNERKEERKEENLNSVIGMKSKMFLNAEFNILS